MEAKIQASQKNQYWATFAVTFGALVAGTSTTWSSPAYRPLVIESVMGFPISDEEFDLVGSIYAIGAMSFCLPAGILANWIGLRLMMLLLVFPTLLGWAMITWAGSVYVIYLGRFILGAASGCFCFSAPMYVREIAEAEIRGELSSYFALLNCIGMLVTYVLGAFVSLKILSLICMALTVVYAVLFIWQPESPLYFVERGDLKKALESLKYFRGSKYDVDTELKEIIQNFNQRQKNNSEKASNGTIWESLRKPSSRKAIIICIVLQLCLQGSGVDVFLFYFEMIFEQSNLSIPSSYAVIIAGLVLVIFTFIASKIVDSSGRRILLILSGIVTILSNTVLSIYYSLDASTAELVNFIPIVSTCVFLAMFAIGHGSVTWIISAEVSPEEIKNMMGSFSALMAWFLAAIVTLYFNRLTKIIGLNWGFSIFAIISTLGLIYIYLFLPETKCLTPEEIQAILGKKKVKKEKCKVSSIDLGTVKKLEVY